MPFSEIIEKSFKYPWKNRPLWFYGILLTIFTGGVNLSNVYDPSEQEMAGFFNKFSGLANLNNWTWLLIGIITFLIIILLIVAALIVTSWSQTAINRGAEQIEKGKKIERKALGKTGKTVIWNMIVLNLFIPITIVISLIASTFIGILIFSVMPQPVGLYLGIVVALIFVLILLGFIAFFSVVWPMAIRFVTNENKKSIESLRLAIKIIKGNFWVSLGFNIVMGMISGMATFILFLPMIIFVLVVMALFVSKIYAGAVIFGIIAVLYLVPLIIAEGYFQSFINTGWTLWWLELKKLKK